MISLYTDEGINRFAVFHFCKKGKKNVIYTTTRKKPFCVQGTAACQNFVIDEQFAVEVEL
jgi:hypothetical protein